MKYPLHFYIIFSLFILLSHESLVSNEDLGEVQKKRELNLTGKLRSLKSSNCLYSIDDCENSCDTYTRYCCRYFKQYERQTIQRLNETIWKQCEAKFSNQPVRGKKLYSIGSDKLRWNEAIQRCEYEGKHLATVKSTEDEQEFEETMIRHGMMNKGYEKVWLGGNDNQQFGKFKWLGRPFVSFTFTNWDKDEPKMGLRDHRCMAAVASTFLWRRDHCTHWNWYACEYERTT